MSRVFVQIFTFGKLHAISYFLRYRRRLLIASSNASSLLCCISIVYSLFPVTNSFSQSFELQNSLFFFFFSNIYVFLSNLFFFFLFFCRWLAFYAYAFNHLLSRSPKYVFLPLPSRLPRRRRRRCCCSFIHHFLID